MALYLNTDKVKKILNGQDKLSIRDIKLAESDIRAILEHEWVHVIQARKVSRNLSSTKEHAVEYSEWHESDDKEPDFKKLGKKVYQLLKPYNRAYTQKLTKQILTTMQLHAKLEGKSLKEFLVDMVSKNGTPKKKLKTITAIALLKRFTNTQEYRSRTSEIQAYATSAANDLIAVYNALTKGHKTYDSDIYTQLGKLIGFYISTQYVDGGKIYKYFVKNLVQAIEQRVKDSKDVKAIIELYKSVAKSARKALKQQWSLKQKKSPPWLNLFSPVQLELSLQVKGKVCLLCSLKRLIDSCCLSRACLGKKPSRWNLYVRDMGTCQYCGRLLTRREATRDHVVPIPKGGRSAWDNLVLCCRSCNEKKGSSVWTPRKRPAAPSVKEIMVKMTVMANCTKPAPILQFEV